MKLFESEARIAAVVLAILTTVLLWSIFASGVVEMYERTTSALNPSAERAMKYGSRHLDARNSGMYDIDAAESFFLDALSLDPAYPYVHHQLARVAFLRGELHTALFYISKEIDLHGDSQPNSYYVRGLIEGYMGRYEDAAEDYEHYLSLLTAPNWAGMTDYAWVLLKAGRNADAARVTNDGLDIFPDNPWLLNTNAIAYFELDEYDRALTSARKAFESVRKVSEDEWLTAYPGNDPQTAQAGLSTFRVAVEDNMHKIEAKAASSTVQ